MRRRRFLHLAGLGGACAAFSTRCGGGRSLEGRIVESYRSAPESLNPLAAFSDVAHELFGRIHSGMLRHDARGMLAPDLAEIISQDQESITLRFVRNATWHDSRPVGADDVVDTFARYSDDAYAFSAPFKAVGKIDVGAWPSVTIRLTRPCYALQLALTSRLLPSHISDLDKDPIGCGYYRVASRAPDRIELSRHDRYHRVVAAIPIVVVRTVPDPTTQYLELMAGEVDVSEISTDLYKKALDDPKMSSRFQVCSVPTKAIEFLFFNLKSLDQLSLRRAISLCIDRGQIVNELYATHGRVVDSPFLDEPWRAGGLHLDAGDLERVRPALAAAGYTRTSSNELLRRGEPVKLQLLYNADSAKRGQMAQVIQHSLKQQLGLAVEIVQIERAQFEKRFFSGAYDLAIYGFGFSADPDDLGNLFRSDSDYNVMSYRSAEVDDLFDRARDMSDGEAKRECYAAIQQHLASDLPCLPILSYNIPIAVSRRIQMEPPAVIGDTYRFTRDQNLWNLA